MLESYCAYLGVADHYNSKGQQPTEFWQVIRQDRVNSHRFGIQDPNEQTDSDFGKIEARADLETVLMQNPVGPDITAAFVGTEIWLRVDICGLGTQPMAVLVQVNWRSNRYEKRQPGGCRASRLCRLRGQGAIGGKIPGPRAALPGKRQFVAAFFA